MSNAAGATHLSWFDRLVVRFFGRKWPSKDNSISVLLLIGVLLCLIGFNRCDPLDNGRLCAWAFAITLLACVPLVWRGRRLFEQHVITGTRSRGRVIAGMSFISLFCLGTLAIGLMLILNGWLDTSMPQLHMARVLSRWISRGRASCNCYVRVSSWRNPGLSEDIRISRTIFNRAKPSISQIVVVTKRGALGFEWVTGYRLQEGGG